jgi:hypothetical protein
VHVPLILAHIGHWSVQLLFAGPVLALVGALVVQSWREKRREALYGPRVDDDE